MNAVVSDHKQSNVAEFKAPGPGERLKAARISLDIDLAKMAEKIHLTKDTVDCLERDDYSEMPARVFVRGYVRNYARVVDLPAESVLHQFDDLWPENDEPASMNTPIPRLPADVKPGNGWVRLMTWLLLLGGGALFLVWWQGYLDQFIDKLNTSPVVQTAVIEKKQAFEEKAVEPPGVEVKTVNKPLPVAESESLAVVEKPPEIGSGNLTLPLPAVSKPAVVEPPVVEVQMQVPEPEKVPVISPLETTDVAVSNVAPSVDVPAIEVTPLEQGVYVSFESASWVDIRDSSRSFKIFGEVKKGVRRKLGGTPPYKFVIGNAAAVKISVDGKPFDMASHVKGNVARFTMQP